MRISDGSSDVCSSDLQPVLSRQIKALEQELGIDLFYRNGRGIVLTEAGKILQDYSGSVLDTVTRATTEVSALRTAPRGTISIGMPPSVGSVLTVPLIQAFRQQFPNITMRVVEGFSGDRKSTRLNSSH